MHWWRTEKEGSRPNIMAKQKHKTEYERKRPRRWRKKRHAWNCFRCHGSAEESVQTSRISWYRCRWPTDGRTSSPPQNGLAGSPVPGRNHRPLIQGKLYIYKKMTSSKWKLIIFFIIKMKQNISIKSDRSQRPIILYHCCSIRVGITISLATDFRLYALPDR